MRTSWNRQINQQDQPHPGVFRQVGTGTLHAMRLLGIAFTLLTGGVAVWAVMSAKRAAAMGANAPDDFGRMFGGAIGAAGSVTFTVVALIAIPCCLAAAAWAYAMHLRLCAARRSPG